MRASFIDDVLHSRARVADAADYLRVSGDGREPREALGLTEEEYVRWSSDPDTLELIVEERRSREMAKLRKQLAPAAGMVAGVGMGSPMILTVLLFKHHADLAIAITIVVAAVIFAVGLYREQKKPSRVPAAS